MGRPRDLGRRAAVLDAVITALADGGVGNRSLRDIAAAAGTTHRMLLHHFESREALLVAVVEEMEARQRGRLAELGQAGGDVLGTMWAELAGREVRPFERLFFECYARGANGEAPFDRLHPGAVTSWLDAAAEAGLDRTQSRLGLAVVRGLLLDLAATGDEAGTTAAVHAFAALLAASPPGSGERGRGRAP